MSQINAMKQVGARNMGIKVEMMEWNNKMDLIAIGTEKGEVLIQRLNWQKVVTFPSPGENIKVKALSWQPDETIIAVAYSNGIVALFDVEKEDKIYELDYKYDIKTLHWTSSVLDSTIKDTYMNKLELPYESYLPNLPKLSTLSSSAKKTDDRRTLKKLSSFLVVCLPTGDIFLLVLGLLPCGYINISSYLKNQSDFQVVDVRLSLKTDKVCIFVLDGRTIKLLIFNNKHFTKYGMPLLNLAMKNESILYTLNYMNETIQCITEAWESVLMEMDNKLTKYANNDPAGSLSADFLELLLFGVMTPELRLFLTRDLTEKGIKKLANSTELSYSSIQNLVTKPLQAASITLFYILNSVEGLSRNAYDYQGLITIEAADKAISDCGSFLMKTVEMQQVIDQCVIDMKLFWCWLLVIMIRLMNENVPEEISQASQEDTLYLAEYLNNFDNCTIENDDGTKIKKKFNLEKVGQYLTNSNLPQPVITDSTHRWNKLLDENKCLQNCPFIFPHDKELSLIQQFDKLKASINRLFKRPDIEITKNFELDCTIDCGNVQATDNIRCSYFVSETKNCDCLVTTTNQSEIILVDLDYSNFLVRCSRLTLNAGPFIDSRYRLYGRLTFVDLQYYNETMLSVLVQDEFTKNYFIQMPLEVFKDKFSMHKLDKFMDMSKLSTCTSILGLLDPNYFKPVEGNCTSIAVSGNRKVASVLSDNYKKIRIYEMEIEDDEDDVEMSQNPLLDTSKE